MTFAGFKLRAAALLSPLLFITACTTQNALNDGMSVQPQASFAATAPSVETVETEQETSELVAAAPAEQPANGSSAATSQLAAMSQPADTSAQALPDAGDIPVPAYAKTGVPKGQSAEKLVQVASLYPPAPKIVARGQVMSSDAYDDPIAGSRRVSAVRASSRDHECLARAMYFESNRSSREGMIAVGSVVMNRLNSGRWGDTVCNVVGANRQFAPGVMTRSMDARGSDLALESAAAVLKGERHPKIYPEVMFFHTAGYRFGYNNMHYVAVAGGNSFYEKRRRMRGMNNTPQHVIMAQSSSRVQRLAEPVKTAFAAPVRAARSLFGSDQEPTRTQQVKRRKPVETVETPVPVSKPTPAPVVQANSGYLKAPSTDMVTVAGSKGGRVLRSPAAAGAPRN